MKKTILTLLAAMTLMLSSCFSTGLGTTSSNSTGGILSSVLGSVLGNVLFGGMTFDQSSLLGNWNYSAPSAAFTTEQALTKAGGAATIANIASALASNYSNIGKLEDGSVDRKQVTSIKIWEVEDYHGKQK